MGAVFLLRRRVIAVPPCHGGDVGCQVLLQLDPENPPARTGRARRIAVAVLTLMLVVAAVALEVAG